ncbi:hypothetical protein K402DRAFT_260815 [Aulographum hederae CBS 113979]|uniref:Uncharacterized protein n=1 Tax=Aulographum hederae CBS 113979 TaxID=1176131 RepID=A0A6G1H9H2_9PEZI|nr:hypothetical protein K402DRAFT_260815 [Aulographum hederae CBS 113979]
MRTSITLLAALAATVSAQSSVIPIQQIPDGQIQNPVPTPAPSGPSTIIGTSIISSTYVVVPSAPVNSSVSIIPTPAPSGNSTATASITVPITGSATLPGPESPTGGPSESGSAPPATFTGAAAGGLQGQSVGAVGSFLVALAALLA